MMKECLNVNICSRKLKCPHNFYPLQQQIEKAVKAEFHDRRNTKKMFLFTGQLNSFLLHCEMEIAKPTKCLYLFLCHSKILRFFSTVDLTYVSVFFVQISIKCWMPFCELIKIFKTLFPFSFSLWIKSLPLLFPCLSPYAYVAQLN